MPGAYSSISQPSPKMPTLFFGDGSHLGVPCRGAPLGRVEREEERIRLVVRRGMGLTFGVHMHPVKIRVESNCIKRFQFFCSTQVSQGIAIGDLQSTL